MIDQVLQPLQVQVEIGVFRDTILKAEVQLCNGELRNLREVEVILLADEKVNAYIEAQACCFY